MLRLAFALLLAIVPGAAWAQGMMTLDTVLIVPPQEGDELVEDIGASLHAALEMMMGSEYLIVPFSSVPDYDDYSAAVYVQSCPAGEYVGCAFVMGSRSNATFVIGMEAEPDRFGGVEVLFTIIDVAESRPVISFSSAAERDNYGLVAAGLSLVLGSVIQGAHNAGDVRGDVEDPRATWEYRRDEARRAAEGLAYADQDLQILVRPEVGEYDEPRLKAADLREFDTRDDNAPWVMVDMSRGEYVRYKNSETTLDEWRMLSKGRQGQFMIYLEGAFGSGSYDLVYDARWVLDSATLDVAETQVFQQMEKSSTTVFGVELTYGILPWLEAGFGLGTRQQHFSWFYQREIEGEELPQPIHEGSTFAYTPEYRLVTNFVPMPTRPVRPLASLDLVFWKGQTIDVVVEVPGPVEPLDRPSYVLAHAGIGAEASPNPMLLVYAKFNMELMLSGERYWEATSSDSLLQDPYDASPLKSGNGWTVQIGAGFRLGPFWGK